MVFSDMLLHSYFIVDFDKYDNLPDVQLPENTRLAYKITATSVQTVTSFYKNIFLFPQKYPFCLLVDISEETDRSEIMLDLLVSFSFHFGYIKDYYDNPLVLFEISKPGDHEYISAVREAFKSQGYFDIVTTDIYKNIDFLPENPNKNIRFNLQESLVSLPSEYINSIKTLTSSNCSVFYFLKYPGQLPEILKVIQEAESIVKENMPQVYWLLSENKFLKLKEDELLSKMELLREQLKSLNAYHSNYHSTSSRYKKQITELLKFYKQEYEILPLWYKRFGHIIKVFTGKRTFNSLFNDKVKKYKV